VKKWQTKMAQRGWQITATGTFDETSDEVCRKFQQEKGLTVDGKVGTDTWRTTWTAPLT
jgi:peptidoglycan hydrolase-like protein with peptidoglycan-binding domain